jgi:hypothetical protein
MLSNSELDLKLVRFQVRKVANMNMTAFWDIVPCSLVEVYRRFRGAYCLRLHHLIGSPLSISPHIDFYIGSR